MVTASPRRRKWSALLQPMKPAPPVINTWVLLIMVARLRVSTCLYTSFARLIRSRPGGDLSGLLVQPRPIAGFGREIDGHQQRVLARVAVVAPPQPDLFEPVFPVERLGDGVAAADLQRHQQRVHAARLQQQVEQQPFAPAAAPFVGMDGDGADVDLSGDEPEARVTDE